MGFQEHTQSRTIDGYIYEVSPVAVGPGRKLLVKLLKIVAPAVKESGLDGVQQAGTGMAKGLALIATLIDRLSDSDLEDAQKLFGPQTRFTRDGEEAWITLTYDMQQTHFAAQYQQLVEWLKFALEVNYGSFFSGWMSRAKAAAASPKTTGSTSAEKTGSSPESFSIPASA